MRDFGAPVRFSVITPTHRRRHSLLRMLDALAGQDYPLDWFEAIVVADGDDDDLPEAVRSRQYPFRLRCISQLRSGPAAARNRGIDVAVEPYALFLDDDVLPRPTLMSEHAASHAEPDVAVIGTLVAACIVQPAPWTRWEWTTLREQYRAMEAGEWEPTPRQFFTGNASVRLEHVKAAGGFNPAFKRGEDVELAWRLHERGIRFVFNPQAEGEHLAERSFDAWLAAAHEYGRTDVMLERIRTGRSLPTYVQDEFHWRHPFTKLLTRAVIGRPEIWRLLPACGRLAVLSANRLGWHAPAGQACSALFSAAYWRGVAEQLGRGQALALTAPVRASTSAQSAA